MLDAVATAMNTTRAAARTIVFFLKVLPMLPSRALNWVTPRPIVERLTYPTLHGEAEGDLYRPSSRGPHPGMVVCLGVVPFGVDHPQVPRLGEALARSGFAALMYWSPAMRDFRLDPEDVDNIALAYDRLLERSDVDERRSGLLGTCVGGSFALMAAAHTLIRERVGFVAAFAPYSSMTTLAVDIASGTREMDGVRESWDVDQLTRKVYERSLTASLDPRDAAAIDEGAGSEGLSEDARLILPLLDTLTVDDARVALSRLPETLRDRLTRLSPLACLDDIRAPLIVFGHDRDDSVIPASESRQLRGALAGREGVHYTEFGLFQHADPTKRKLPLPQMVRQLWKFFRYVYPIYRQAV